MSSQQPRPPDCVEAHTRCDDYSPHIQQKIPEENSSLGRCAWHITEIASRRQAHERLTTSACARTWTSTWPPSCQEPQWTGNVTQSAPCCPDCPFRPLDMRATFEAVSLRSKPSNNQGIIAGMWGVQWVLQQIEPASLTQQATHSQPQPCTFTVHRNKPSSLRYNPARGLQAQLEVVYYIEIGGSTFMIFDEQHLQHADTKAFQLQSI